MAIYYSIISGDVYEEDFDFFELDFHLDTSKPLKGQFPFKRNSTIGQGVFFDNLVKIISDELLGGRRNYVRNFQDATMKILSTLIVDRSGVQIDINGITEDISSYIDNLSDDQIYNPFQWAAIWEGLKERLANSLVSRIKNNNPFYEEESLTYEEAYSLVEQLDEIILGLIQHPNYCLSSYMFFKKTHEFRNGYEPMPVAILVHYPEVSQAWLESTSSDDICFDSSYRIIRYDCPVDIKVYDLEDHLLASIISNDCQTYNNSTICAYIDDNGSKCFVLPNDGDYVFEVLGRSDGVVNVSLVDYDFSKMKNISTKNYYNIEVTEGTKLTGKLLSIDPKNETSTLLLSDANNDISVSEKFDSSGLPKYKVKVLSGTSPYDAVDLRTYQRGEFAKVSAYLYGDTDFIGWYENDELISIDPEYRFPVFRDTNLICKFEPHTHSYSCTVEEFPSCVSSGSKTFCCACGDTYTETIDPLGHAFGEWTVSKEPTCQEEGEEERICANDSSHRETRSIDPVDHKDDNKNGKCDYCNQKMTGKNRCKYCGKIHKGFGGFFTKIIHAILYFFAHLFRRM